MSAISPWRMPPPARRAAAAPLDRPQSAAARPLTAPEDGVTMPSAPVPPTEPSGVDARPPEECLAFVRFCYRRRPVAWPELYDEMCAVAARGVYHGMGYQELYDQGIALCLGDLPKLAALVELVVDEERAAGGSYGAEAAATDEAVRSEKGQHRVRVTGRGRLPR